MSTDAKLFVLVGALFALSLAVDPLVDWILR